MSKVQFTLTVEFNKELAEGQIADVAHNINCAIIHAIGNTGITPEDSEALTENVTLTHESGVISCGTAYPSQVTTGDEQEGDLLTTRI